MCKTREKNNRAPDKIIRKSSKGFRFRGIIVMVLWCVFIVSVGIKLWRNEGIASLLVSCICKTNLQHWAFFNPNALLEVAKTIGVFSVFIVWIYAELGKNELGRQYTELLSIFCKHYHLRALSYILAILACIYIATIGILESAGIAMVIAAIGLWDQAWVLIGFIFNPSVRKELAVRQWEESFCIDSENKNQISSVSLTDIYALVEHLSVKDDYFDNLCKLLAKGILVHTLNDKGSFDFSNEKIISVSHIWERLLDGRPYHEQHLIQHNVLKEIYYALDDDSKKEQKQLIICAGYLQQQIRYYTKIDRLETDDDILICILSHINQIRHKLPTANKNRIAITDCLETLYALFCWMHFLCNNITFNQDILQFLSYYEPIYDDYFKECFKVFILCTFDGNAYNGNFDTAWNQVRKY